MSIEPCPHCYRKTIPLADGTCPSCGKNTKDLAQTDPDKVLVGIRSGQRLPAVCHACGVQTQTAKRLAVSSQPQNTTLVGGIGPFIRHLLGPLGLIDKLERHNQTVDVWLKLPTCKECARTLRRITPHYIDFEARRIDLVVHVNFKNAIKEGASGPARA